MKLLHVTEGLLLAEYLQIEQDLAAQVKEPTLFTWVVTPTVIFGRHQSAEVEVNETYCRENGIHVVQRKSGGGCVYADEGNVMVSYITPATNVPHVFGRFIARMAKALRQMGYPAVSTAHNDILVDGHKVSGSACYKLSKATIVHATMLYDVNLDSLQQAITPTAEKLAKHAVQSVRQRVVNLKTIKDLGSTNTFRQTLESLIQ